MDQERIYPEVQKKVKIKKSQKVLFKFKIMGEAKRREEVGLPPRQKNELNKSDRYLSWLPITKSRIKKYLSLIHI